MAQAIMDAGSGSPAHVHKGEGGAFGRTGFAWAWFEAARNPYYILIVIYVFAPYFARDIVGADILASGKLNGLSPEEAHRVAGAEGQATVANLSKTAGYIAALTAPFLGAAFDRGLRRKPLILLCLSLIALVGMSLWWAIPGPAGLSTAAIMALLIAAYVSYSYSEVAHNSMLPDAARLEALPAVSGLGLALGNGLATLMFVALVLMFALPDALGWPFAEPLFGIDTSQYEQFRIAGPICGVWLLFSMLPFFLYAKDTGVKGTSPVKAVKEGAQGVIRTIRKATHHKEAFKFLIARTIYADGMFALLTIGAVYVSLFLGWGLIELTIYAIWASAWGVVGGFFGGWLDQKVGPKNALLIELAAIVLILFLGLSVTRESAFFGLVPNVKVWNAQFFSGTSDLIYLAQGALIAVFATANISSSRSMLVHVAPPHMRGEFFGLFAIAGTVTVWLGPLLIEQFTRLSGDQRIGMSAIALLFFLGFAMLLTVRSVPPAQATEG
ncbi:MFS transporter [Hyphomonas sp. WL0036]|uniref:MFS transporter n=1 Tax=Hyphomonas sediminis TaxID=2866160 RepID=UPI001C814B6E|nr:MFS transporter [Hyphomonas sediminis]MBY9066534.1 MFS transporter [Hyphomonas sediminis]